MTVDQEDPRGLANLSPADQMLLDAMIPTTEHEGLSLADDPEAPVQAVPDDESRAQRVAQVVSLIKRCGVDAVPGDLTQRTIERVRDARQRRRFAQQVQSLSGPDRMGLGFRWRELVTVAAVLMIGVSLLWPAVEQMRGNARQVACANNLAVAGGSLGRYAADHDNLMPRGNVKPGAVWWNVGHDSDSAQHVQSNSAHLYILVRSGYIDADTLCCPDNPWAVEHLDSARHDWPHAAAVSYSYQNQYTAKAIRLDQLPHMAILADKNPLFAKRSDGGAGLAYRADLDPASPSDFHNRRGQNILTSSGRVMWTTQPIGPNGDNVWLIRGVQAYRGVETPQEADDSFLVP